MEVQNIIRNNIKYKGKVKPANMPRVFAANLILFIIVLLVFGFFIRADDFKTNFINVLVLGEVLNLFDLLIIDLLWWRNTKRIRFSEIPEKEMYQDPKLHIESFFRGAIMYLMAAPIDGGILTML